ncbi:uncharacterized protein LOC111634211 [Centruroides sculpturatus]|uniref:uncharacterized protein LOC111634211 n=1 Tax=Centruroides sculpturatus TaxID=218467 RepID=UPI000C6CF213|nr:uncharacterized protein LOC111634211 [Centruroides sculpturatus]
MADDSGSKRRDKSSCKEKRIFFMKMLEDVLLTGVPQIVTESDGRRKIFKIIVFFACLSGFLYHLISYIILYLAYPTTLDVLVEFKETEQLPKPVLTICDLNGLRRIPLCKDFPEECEKPKNMKALCERFEYFCKDSDVDNLMFPTHNLSVVSDYLRSIVDIYGPTVDDILKNYSNLTTPVFYTNTYRKLRKCYSLDLAKFDNSYYTVVYDKFNAFISEGELVGTILVTFNPKEISNPSTPVGAKVSVHNRDQLVNPFLDGFQIKPGRTYNVKLKAVQENLLDSPYNTNCTDYEKQKDKGFNGIYSRDFCIIECRKELWLENCNCVLGEYNFPFTGNFCDEEEEFQCISDVDVDKCYKQCRRGCKIWYSTISVFYKRPEILVYKYKPQYELIEFFSYIGGYIGIWLGISLIAVFDFLEMLFVYFCCIIRGKIPTNKETNSNILLESKPSA